jgi:hypothetical protein
MDELAKLPKHDLSFTELAARVSSMGGDHCGSSYLQSETYEEELPRSLLDLQGRRGEGSHVRPLDLGRPRRLSPRLVG